MEFVHPFTSIIAGASGSGKTVWVSRFLRNINHMCDVNFDRVLLYYTEWQDTYRCDFRIESGPTVEFR